MLVALRNGTNLRYMHQDSLGSTSVVTDSSGAQYGYTRYYPYGSTRDSGGSLDTSKKFTGQRLDGTGLYYYGARYYDPTIGRFISPDSIIPNPANPQSLNRYSYCLNNPLRYIDPSGHTEINWGYDTATGQPLLPPASAFAPGGYYNGQFGNAHVDLPSITVHYTWNISSGGRGGYGNGPSGDIYIGVQYRVVDDNTITIDTGIILTYNQKLTSTGVQVEPVAKIIVGSEEDFFELTDEPPGTGSVTMDQNRGSFDLPTTKGGYFCQYGTNSN